MKKIFAVAVLILISLFTVGKMNPTDYAMAEVEFSPSRSVSYTWSYDHTNVYNARTITYSFSGLDSGTIYRWDMYTVDPLTGALVESLGQVATTNVTSTTATFGGGIDQPVGSIIFPVNYVGPIAIVDYYSQTILGRHYVAQLPGYTNSPGSEWFTGGGNTAVNERQVIGPRQFAGFCQNPAYGPINSDGWFHTFKPCSVATITDGFAILHYQMSPTYVTSSDYIEFYDMPGSTGAISIYFDDIAAYQTDTSIDSSTAYSFIIVNTSGEQLPFIDNNRAVASFTTGSNPAITSLDPGVYNYVRTDGSWISDGESVWIITDDPDLNEWTLTGVSEVGQSGNQTLRANAVTPEIWDSYHGYQLVADSDAGYSNTTIYGFRTTRTHTYQVSSTPSDDVTVQWINRASGINSGLATVAEMEFEVQHIYNVVDVVTFEESISQVLTNTGLDTDSGSAILLTLLLFFGMILTAGISGLTGNIYAYLVVWTAIGSTFVLGGYGTLLVDTVYIIMTIVMWVFAMLIGGVISEENG